MLNDETSQPVLVGQGGPLNGHRWFLSDEIIIGRTSSCDISVTNQQVSREHARVFRSGKGAALEDLGSKNGTFHNGKPVTEVVTLEEGDVIQIALAQEFVYFGQDATVPLSPDDFESSVISYFRRIRLENSSSRTWILNRELIPPLSVLQFRLLSLFSESHGRILTRAEVINSVWGTRESVGVTDQALDALIRRLRDRIAEIDPDYKYILTVRGQGYRFDNPPFRKGISG
ncbi:MAG: hypothetical protein DRI65_01620 [Chloroflexota bacterium]|nr:MAG: hypothetical protein DRI65_01620 [Chloroflexota bacterium]